MRLPLLLAVFLALISPVLAKVNPPADPLLVQGLETCIANSVTSGVRIWYTDNPELAAEMTAKVAAATAPLGIAVDSEVVAVQTISKRMTRYYVALYFARSPLWLRIDRYQGPEKSFYLPLKCSTDPDQILPGYVTDFLAVR